MEGRIYNRYGLKPGFRPRDRDGSELFDYFLRVNRGNGDDLSEVSEGTPKHTKNNSSISGVGGDYVNQALEIESSRAEMKKEVKTSIISVLRSTPEKWFSVDDIQFVLSQRFSVDVPSSVIVEVLDELLDRNRNVFSAHETRTRVVSWFEY